MDRQVLARHKDSAAVYGKAAGNGKVRTHGKDSGATMKKVVIRPARNHRTRTRILNCAGIRIIDKPGKGFCSIQFKSG